ncbi:MAG: hypothetical protein HQL94_02775 [Magnetococcales bacterium]|nr:hypothetical protein [Magnetococcales bacterium]MBF0438805.1 hypothetical protein [Magnetococcales bacterium]
MMPQMQTESWIDQALSIVEVGPEHPAFDDAWEYLAMSKEPAVREAMRMALEEIFGPHPLPTEYNDDGEPYWRTSIIAAYLNIPEEEIIETALEMQEKWGYSAGVASSHDLHSVH